MGGEAEFYKQCFFTYVFYSMSIIPIIIGLVIWLVVPILTTDVIKKDRKRKRLLCYAA